MMTQEFAHELMTHLVFAHGLIETPQVPVMLRRLYVRVAERSFRQPQRLMVQLLGILKIRFPLFQVKVVNSNLLED